MPPPDAVARLRPDVEPAEAGLADGRRVVVIVAAVVVVTAVGLGCSRLLLSVPAQGLTIHRIRCTVLYCTVLYCTALHCTVLYYTVLVI